MCVYMYVRIYRKTYTSSSRNSLDGGSHRVQGLWSKVLNRGVIQRSIPGVIQGELGVQTIAHACVCGSSKNRGGGQNLMLHIMGALRKVQFFGRLPYLFK